MLGQAGTYKTKSLTSGGGNIINGAGICLEIHGTVTACAAGDRLYAVDSTTVPSNTTDLTALNSVCLGTVAAGGNFSFDKQLTGWSVANGVTLVLSSTAGTSLTKDTSGAIEATVEMQ